MLTAEVTKQHTDSGTKRFGDCWIKMKIFNQQFYKKDIETEVGDYNNKITKQLNMSPYT